MSKLSDANELMEQHQSCQELLKQITKDCDKAKYVLNDLEKQKQVVTQQIKNHLNTLCTVLNVNSGIEYFRWRDENYSIRYYHGVMLEKINLYELEENNEQ